MTNSLIQQMLDDWDRQSAQIKEQVSTSIDINKEDLVKVQALAEVYQLPAADLLANLINNALLEVEAHMPYVAGPKVIRFEEDEPIYEDIGRTPGYLAAKARLGSS